jgi:hypothetical protein
MEVWVWLVERYDYCKLCKLNNKPTDSDCEECEYNCPELLEENNETWRLWNVANRQWCVGTVGNMDRIMSIPLGLDYTAMFTIANAMDIDVCPSMLRKIHMLEKYEIERIRKELENGN